MARWTRLIPVLAVSIVLGACGQGTADTPFSPPAARLDGGGTILGGNYVPPSGDDSQTTTTTSSTPDPTPFPKDTTGATGGTILGGT